MAFFNSEDFDLVESKVKKKPALNCIVEEDEDLEKELETLLEEREETYSRDGTLSNSDDAGKYRPVDFEIEEWRQAVEALSSRSVKYDGRLFKDLDPVPLVEALDPPPYTCFNCWKRGHSLKECPEPCANKYCLNCGRREETVYSCPRCSRIYHQLYAESNGEWQRWADGIRQENDSQLTNEPYGSNGKLQKEKLKGKWKSGHEVPRGIANRMARAKIHREIFQSDEAEAEEPNVDGSVSQTPLRRPMSRICRNYLQSDEAKIKEWKADSNASQTPEGEPTLSASKNNLQSDEAEMKERKMVSIGTQTPQHFMPYVTSPKEEYETLKREPISEDNRDYSQNDEVNSKEREVSDSVSEASTLRNNYSQSGESINTEKPKVAVNNDKAFNNVGYRQESLKDGKAAKETSPKGSRPRLLDLLIQRYKSTEKSKIDRKCSVANRKWPKDGIKECRQIATSTALKLDRVERMYESATRRIEQVLKSLDPLKAQRSTCGNISDGYWSEEENCHEIAEIVIDDSKLNEINFEEKFLVDKEAYLKLLAGVRHLDRRFQDDIKNRDLSQAEIDRILPMLKNIKHLDATTQELIILEELAIDKSKSSPERSFKLSRINVRFIHNIKI